MRKRVSVINFSYEVFPPKNQEAEQKIDEVIQLLAPFNPAFISVTYGAGGTTRDYTHKLASAIAAKATTPAAAHLTCVGAKREQVDDIAREHWNAGVKHIVALRGDAPKGATNYEPFEGGYLHSSDLISGLKAIGNFEISVAAFPEKHPESASFEEDIATLKLKASLGADRAITQFFFDDDYYLRLRDRCVKADITMPIVAGIMPINNYLGIKKFSASCGTTIPDWVHAKFEAIGDDLVAHDAFAIQLATDQCRKLMEEGVEHLHFYSMNRGDMIAEVLKNIS